MLNRFFGRLKEATPSQKIEELDKRVEELTQQVSELRTALIKTQDVLGKVARAQTDFMLEFENLIRVAQTTQSQLESERVIEKKEDSDIWN